MPDPLCLRQMYSKREKALITLITKTTLTNQQRVATALLASVSLLAVSLSPEGVCLDASPGRSVDRRQIQRRRMSRCGEARYIVAIASSSSCSAVLSALAHSPSAHSNQFDRPLRRKTAQVRRTVDPTYRDLYTHYQTYSAAVLAQLFDFFILQSNWFARLRQA